MKTNDLLRSFFSPHEAPPPSLPLADGDGDGDAEGGEEEEKEEEKEEEREGELLCLLSGPPRRCRFRFGSGSSCFFCSSHGKFSVFFFL